ncbi:MAG TPA: membrane protein insertase YidC, partial [Bacteroidia bacterium]|nr:membrane protein insertase YidC [Bacteroidia bacterium]
MDKKSLTGFILIALIFLAWSIYNSKEKEKEAAAEKHYTDSVFTADSLHSLTEQKQKKHAQDSIAALSRNAAPVNKDSLVKAKETAVFGCFSKSVFGDNKPVVIENEKLKAWIYPRGGIIGQVELKGQKTSDGKPLILFCDDSTHFGLGFFDQQRRRLRTDSLYFNVYGSGFSVKGAEHNSVTLRLYTDDDKGYIEYCYTLKGNSNLVGCTVSFRNMNTVFPDDMHTVDLNWVMKAPSQEMSIKNQRAISTVFYNFDGEDGVESLSETKDEKKDFTGEPKWVSFKQQYFSSILIADRKFANSGTVEVKTPSDPFIVKNLGAVIGIPFGHTARETFPIKMYFGPNKFSELSSYHLHLEREINLGSSFFGSINRYIFVPLFSFLGGIFPNNYGLVILLLTVIVKIVLFPIAYKSFISAAKM